MAEVTRVPLQPIRKGSLTKLWLGVVALLLVGAAVAWAAAPNVQRLADGVTMVTLEEGKGLNPGPADYVLVNYIGSLPDGTVFDQGEAAPMQVNRVVPGFSTALQAMQVGGSYRINIPSDQAYGEQGGGPIPPNSDLTFEVDLLEHHTEAEVMQMMQQQQMMQMLQQQQGGQVPPPAQ